MYIRKPRHTQTELACLSHSDVYHAWPLVEKRLQKAIRRTGLSDFNCLKSEILEGHALLWLALSGTCEDVEIDAVATTSLQLTDAGKVCVITACEGKGMARWLRLIGGIEAYAKAEGCRSVRIFGRKGWLRALPGYRQHHVIIDKTLD